MSKKCNLTDPLLKHSYYPVPKCLNQNPFQCSKVQMVGFAMYTKCLFCSSNSHSPSFCQSTKFSTSCRSSLLYNWDKYKILVVTQKLKKLRLWLCTTSANEESSGNVNVRKQDHTSLVCITPPFFPIPLVSIGCLNISVKPSVRDSWTRLQKEKPVTQLACQKHLLLPCFCQNHASSFEGGTYTHHIKHIPITWISVKILLWKSPYSP